MTLVQRTRRSPGLSTDCSLPCTPRASKSAAWVCNCLPLIGQACTGCSCKHAEAQHAGGPWHGSSSGPTMIAMHAPEQHACCRVWFSGVPVWRGACSSRLCRSCLALWGCPSQCSPGPWIGQLCSSCVALRGTCSQLRSRRPVLWGACGQLDSGCVAVWRSRGQPRSRRPALWSVRSELCSTRAGAPHAQHPAAEHGLPVGVEVGGTRAWAEGCALPGAM